MLVVWRLDRLGRNLRHLILLLDELAALGVAFVSLGEGIDTSTPAAGSNSTYPARLPSSTRARERVRAGPARAPARRASVSAGHRSQSRGTLATVAGLSVREAARQLGVSKSVVWAARQASEKATQAREADAASSGLNP